MIRIVATGDLHIGQGRELADDRLAEQESVWREILRASREDYADVSMVVHVGDMWESRRPSPDEYVAVVRPLFEHHLVGGPQVVVVAGNHDRDGVEDTMALHVLAHSGLIVLDETPGVVNITRSGRKKTHGQQHVGLTGTDVPIFGFATLPWSPVSRLVEANTALGRDDIFRLSAELLLTTAEALRKQCDPDLPCVLALHWSIDQASLPSGMAVSEMRETILPLAGLRDLGFDVVIAGHIHKQQVMSDDPTVFYVGSPMPLNFGEGRDDHGFWTVTIADGVTPQPGMAEFHTINSRRFLTLDYGDKFDEVWLDAATAAAETIGGAAFVKVRGEMSPEQAAGLPPSVIRAALEEGGAAKVMVEMDVVRPDRARDTTITADLTAHGALAAYLEATGELSDELLERADRYMQT